MNLSQVAAYNRRVRRRVSQNLALFRGMIGTPISLGSAAQGEELDPVTVPANGRLAVALDEATDPGDIVVSVDSVDMGIVGGSADLVHRLSYVERGKVVTVTRGASAPAGTLTLYVLDEWQRPRTIATGTFA